MTTPADGPDALPLKELDLDSEAALAPREQAWLVDQWIPAGDVVVVAGSSFGFESLALQLTAAVCSESGLWLPASTGAEELGLRVAPVRQGVVVYASYETHTDRFLEHWAELRGPLGAGLIVEAPPRHIDLSLTGELALQDSREYGFNGVPLYAPAAAGSDDERGAPTVTGHQLLDQAAAAGARLLVIDSALAACCDTATDDDPVLDHGVMREFLRWLRSWSQDTGCTVLVGYAGYDIAYWDNHQSWKEDRSAFGNASTVLRVGQGWPELPEDPPFPKSQPYLIVDWSLCGLPVNPTHYGIDPRGDDDNAIISIYGCAWLLRKAGLSLDLFLLDTKWARPSRADDAAADDTERSENADDPEPADPAVAPPGDTTERRESADDPEHTSSVEHGLRPVVEPGFWAWIKRYLFGRPGIH